MSDCKGEKEKQNIQYVGITYSHMHCGQVVATYRYLFQNNTFLKCHIKTQMLKEMKAPRNHLLCFCTSETVLNHGLIE